MDIVPVDIMLHEIVLWFLLGAGAVAAAIDVQSPLPNIQPLRFTINGTFHVSVFEDLHYGEGWSDSM